jgi:hypothetical protein
LFLSRNANRFARLLLQLPFFEYVTSFRAAKLDRVPAGLIEGTARQGYGFFINSMVRLARGKLVIAEVPIRFRNRHGGKSKIPRLEILRGIANLLWLAIDRRPAKRSALPDFARLACGGHYRVTMKSGEVLCLDCLAKNPSQNYKGSNPSSESPLQTQPNGQVCESDLRDRSNAEVRTSSSAVRLANPQDR